VGIGAVDRAPRRPQRHAAAGIYGQAIAQCSNYKEGTRMNPMLRAFANDLRGFLLVSNVFVLVPSLLPAMRAWLELEGNLAVRHFYAGGFIPRNLMLFANELKHIQNELIVEGIMPGNAYVGAVRNPMQRENAIEFAFRSMYLKDEVSIVLRITSNAQLQEIADRLVGIANETKDCVNG
jgi:hypothetical protein